MVLLPVVADVEGDLDVADSLSVVYNREVLGTCDGASGFDADTADEAQDVDIEVEVCVGATEVLRVFECRL